MKWARHSGGSWGRMFCQQPMSTVRSETRLDRQLEDRAPHQDRPALLECALLQGGELRGMEFHLSVESPLAHKGCWSCPFLPYPVWSGCSPGAGFSTLGMASGRPVYGETTETQPLVVRARPR